MTRICSICARGGSKGVPDKNLRPLLGKPLIAWSVEQARASALFAVVAVSSDSPAILAAAEDAGAMQGLIDIDKEIVQTLVRRFLAAVAIRIAG